MSADFADETRVEIPDQHFIVCVGGSIADQTAPWTDEVGRPVVVRSVEVLRPDPVDSAHEVLVGDRCRRLLQLPEILGRQTIRIARGPPARLRSSFDFSNPLQRTVSPFLTFRKRGDNDRC